MDPALHRYIIGSLFILAGILHFLKPDIFKRIMPDYLPWHKELVLISGFFEIIGGIGLMLPFAQVYAAWGLILLLVAVFPANVEMFRNYYKRRGLTPFVWALIFRLPLQLVLIWWVYWAGL